MTEEEHKQLQKEIEAERRGREMGRRQADIDNFEAHEQLRLCTNALSAAMGVIESGQTLALCSVEFKTLCMVLNDSRAMLAKGIK